MKKPLALICSLALVPALAACGEDEEDTGDKGGAAPKEAPGPAKTTVEPAKQSVAVKMKNVEFQPEDVTVAKGGTVRWTNDEDVPHDVTKKGGPGKDFSSGRADMQKGDTYEQSFPAAGKIDYLCTVHPKMVGTITVK